MSGRAQPLHSYRQGRAEAHHPPRQREQGTPPPGQARPRYPPFTTRPPRGQASPRDSRASFPRGKQYPPSQHSSSRNHNYFRTSPEPAAPAPSPDAPTRGAAARPWPYPHHLLARQRAPGPRKAEGPGLTAARLAPEDQVS